MRQGLRACGIGARESVASPHGFRQLGYSWFSLISYFVRRYGERCLLSRYRFRILYYLALDNERKSFPRLPDITNKDVYAY